MSPAEMVAEEVREVEASILDLPPMVMAGKVSEAEARARRKSLVKLLTAIQLGRS